MEATSSPTLDIESRTSSDDLLSSASGSMNDIENFLTAPLFRTQKTRTEIAKWTLVTILWILSLLTTAAWFSHKEAVSSYSYETGFETDLGKSNIKSNNILDTLLKTIPAPIRPFIELKQVKFIGGLKFDENGTTYRSIEPGATQYVGEPSEEIDRAWRQLIQGMSFTHSIPLQQVIDYFLLPGEEVDLIGEESTGVAGKTYQKEGIWWFTGADVFHQLHCVVRFSLSIRSLNLR